MWIYDFYVKYFNWLVQLTRIDTFLPWTAEGSVLNDLPILIIKLVLMMPFLLIVLWIPILFIVRVCVWMFGCWIGCADNIYED